ALAATALVRICTRNDSFAYGLSIGTTILLGGGNGVDLRVKPLFIHHEVRRGAVASGLECEGMKHIVGTAFERSTGNRRRREQLSVRAHDHFDERRLERTTAHANGGEGVVGAQLQLRGVDVS